MRRKHSPGGVMPITSTLDIDARGPGRPRLIEVHDRRIGGLGFPGAGTVRFELISAAVRATPTRKEIA